MFTNKNATHRKVTGDTHSDVLATAVIDFIKAWSYQEKKFKKRLKKANGAPVKKYVMKFRKKKDPGSISIRSREISFNGDNQIIMGNRLRKKNKVKRQIIKKGTKKEFKSAHCYPDKFGEKKRKDNLCCKQRIKLTEHECRLVWYGENNFTLIVSYDIEDRPRRATGKICALDPGVCNFQTIYDPDGIVYNIRDKTKAEYKEQLKQAKLACIGCDGKTGKLRVKPRIIDQVHLANRLRRGIQRDGTKAPNRRVRKNMLNKARKVEAKIKNKTDDVHHKLSKFLCRAYDTVIIPKFSAKRCAAGKKLSKETNLAMYRWGHYRFRTLLISKGAKYGTKIMVGTEEYTSITCGNCFNVKYDLGKARKYHCNNCDAHLGRDDNAARNILMLNWDRFNIQAGLPSTHRPLG